MTTPLENIVAAIDDSSLARIKLSLKGGSQQHFDCIFKEDPDNSPHFSLVFPPETLPVNIDRQVSHPVSILQEPDNPTLNAEIIEVKSDRNLYLLATGTIDPASLREYFRVNTSTEITASHKTSSREGALSSWSISGQTMDLSASGVLALFDEEPKHKDQITLEIYLPNEKVKVDGVGHVVHKKKLRRQRWLVAFHFDTISSKHRDFIIAYLLSEQRRQLRENIRTDS